MFATFNTLLNVDWAKLEFSKPVMKGGAAPSAQIPMLVLITIPIEFSFCCQIDKCFKIECDNWFEFKIFDLKN